MNFLELIEIYEIQIPLIQRDYVLGLDVKKAKRFLKALKGGFERGLNLDFIYGYKKNNKFIPIDGQQRLTTLYLLTYYFSLESEFIPSLEKFSYMIRPSAKDFFRALTKKEHWSELKRENLVTQIEDSNWFHLGWRRDLSVRSALAMLKMIEEEFLEYEVQRLEKIVFEFLDLQEFDLGEELYVKMNARGKQLSDFENFKVEFEKYIDDLDTKAKLDNAWLDVFWRLKKEEAEQYYYNFFYNVVLLLLIENNKIDKNFVKNNDLLDFQELVFKEQENVKRIIKLLDKANKYKKLEEFTGKTDLTYLQRLEFYIWASGVLKELDEKNQKRWERIGRNLIENTRIEEVDDLTKATRALKSLNDTFCKDVYKEIDFSGLSFFSKKQREEESRKVKLINSNFIWEKELVEAENHWYLQGQIDFLIEYSKENIEKFRFYKKRFFGLFDERTQREKQVQTLIHRAYLVIDPTYYPRHNWHKFTFCSFETRLRIKQENWRHVFDKSKNFQQFLEKIEDKNQLQEIVDGFEFDSKKWQSYIINPKESWSVLEDTVNFQFQKDNDESIYLNSGHNIKPNQWGWRLRKELRSYYLFKKLFTLKDRSKRVYWWRLEAEDEHGFEAIYYDIRSDGTENLGIVFEKESYDVFLKYKGNNSFAIYKIFYDNKDKEYEKNRILHFSLNVDEAILMTKEELLQYIRA